MTTAITPPWLAAWRARGCKPLTQPQPPPTPAPAPKPAPVAVQDGVQRTVNTLGYSEPAPWPFDGFDRREAVLDSDLNPPRVVRKVGWQRCMRCHKPFWSEDVMRLRMCGGADGGCRGEQHGRQPKVR